MNPSIKELMERLEVYSKIDYGTPAYELSSAEAKIIVQLKADVLNLIKDIYVFAGRPTKDGAKNLRQVAATLEERINE